MKTIAFGALALVSTIAAAAPGFSDTVTGLSGGRWKTMTTQQLAAKLLPPELAAQVVSHEASEPPAPEGAPRSVTFHAKPGASANGVCARKSYYVSVYARAIVPIEIDDVRLGPCPMPADAPFAHVQAPTTVAQAGAALRWLDQARRSPLEADLSCKSEGRPEACRDAGAVLTKLPVENASVVGASNGVDGELNFAFRDAAATAESGSTWQVKVAPAGGARRHIDITLLSPPMN